jgi:malate dehydrogenase
MTSFPYALTTSSRKVAIIGSGKVGSTLAQQVTQQNIADVVLLDIVEGLPQGIALDLTQARGIIGQHCHVVGTNDYEDTAGSDIVVITAGIPRRPGMSRTDLLQTNAKIVREAAKGAIAHSPDAIVIVVTNPLDVMTYLAWQVTQLPPQRVMGMAGVLDSARLQAFIAMELSTTPDNVNTMVLGGHGDSMVPLIRYCTVGGVPLTELLPSNKIEKLVTRTRQGGAEIVKLMQTGSAYFAPAAATRLMIDAILSNQSRLLTACTYLQGEYGLNDIFMGVPCRLDRTGVESVTTLELTAEETSALHQSAQEIRESIVSVTSNQ